jgi:hypothetical protein
MVRHEASPSTFGTFPRFARKEMHAIRGRLSIRALHSAPAFAGAYNTVRNHEEDQQRFRRTISAVGSVTKYRLEPGHD